jgi:hypothetical protein
MITIWNIYYLLALKYSSIFIKKLIHYYKLKQEAQTCITCNRNSTLTAKPAMSTGNFRPATHPS